MLRLRDFTKAVQVGRGGENAGPTKGRGHMHGAHTTLSIRRMPGADATAHTQLPQITRIPLRPPRKRSRFRPGYGRDIDPLARKDRMRYWIAKAAMDARESAERIQAHVAAELGQDQSTVARFEEPANENRKQREIMGWPRDVDETIAAYARDLGVDPRDLWARALELWIANERPSDEHAGRTCV